MKSVNFKAGDITVDGVEGVFTQTNKCGGWCHIHHAILNDNGIGCKSRVFVGSVSKGNFGSHDIPAIGNNKFGEQVVETIERYLQRSATNRAV